LDSDQFQRNEPKYQFTVSGDAPSHKLLIEFLPITSEPIALTVHLSGSGGGNFVVPIELSEGITQTRYFRFKVEDRPFSIGVG
jgi:hypothetical protein